MSLVPFLLAVLSQFISLTVYDYVYGKILNEPFTITNHKSVIYYIFSIVSIAIEINCPNFIKIILFGLCHILPILFYKSKLSKKTNIVLLSIITILLSDQITNCISTYSYCNLIKNNYIILSLNTIVMLAIYNLILTNKYSISLIQNINYTFSYSWFILFSSLFWIFEIYFLIYLDTFISVNNYVKIIILIIAINTSIITLLFNYIVIKYNISQKYCQKMILNNKGNEEIFKKYRIKVHNIKNFLHGLKCQDVNDLIESINSYLNTNENRLLFQGSIIPYGISGYISIIIQKYSSITWNIIGSELIEKVNYKNIKFYNEICDAIGIIFDNAYEASIEAGYNQINIIIEQEKNNIIIKVINKFKNDIYFNEIGQAFSTTKLNGNGIGIYSITKTKSIKLRIQIINNNFITIISFKN